MKIALAQMKMTPEIQLTPFFPQFKDENVSYYVMTIDDPYGKQIFSDETRQIVAFHAYVTKNICLLSGYVQSSSDGKEV